ncbi:MAG: DUF839 domain-containing protein [Bacteroidetes bacterium]|nr:MAG: DUF839 domain-containing protein [Bacteroidota bacterium]
MNESTSRRHFLRQASLASLGFMTLSHYACQSPAGKPAAALPRIFGPLQPDPAGLFSLPEGFSYRVISRWGEEMADGLLLPNRADGMATFPGPDGKVILIRNHEVSSGDLSSGAFGEDQRLLEKVRPEQCYDYGQGQQPGLGGTTTLVYNEETGEVEKQFMSLAGTTRNCAGGPTPWNSWITCEETVEKAGFQKNEKDHGYNFEVPASTEPGLAEPVPLKAMGRFNHEAVCVDPRTSIVYQTEDRGDGLIYRFIPHVPEQLARGGRLQVLAIKGRPSTDTRNWPVEEGEAGPPPFPVGEWVEVEWLDIDQVESPEDDLRHRGFAAGAARFARGEGMWFGEEELFFACTNGGQIGKGQVFRYQPSSVEGTPAEVDQPGRLMLFAEPNDVNIVQSCDNLTVSPWGDLFLCEDDSNPRLVRLTPQGEFSHFGANIGHPDSELTGVCFSPSGKTLFVNIQHYGLTLAITGPWEGRVA